MALQSATAPSLNTVQKAITPSMSMAPLGRTNELERPPASALAGNRWRAATTRHTAAHALIAVKCASSEMPRPPARPPTEAPTRPPALKKAAKEVRIGL